MKMFIGDLSIGENSPAMIVAELSANHCGDLEIAKRTIQAMKESGADAVKLQTFTAESLTIEADTDYFQIKSGLWKGHVLYEVYKEAMTPWEWHEDLKRIAKDEGLVFFSSPFSSEAVDFLLELGVDALKIASPEITDIPLIEKCANNGLPIIFSSGVATFEDLELAISTCRRLGNNSIALLKCTTSYPTKLEEMNLASLRNIEEKLGVITGLSDHSPGYLAPVVAISMGAKIVEKHFILDRTLKSVDAAFSMQPDEFKEMVTQIRNTEIALGESQYRLTDEMVKKRSFIARSLFVVESMRYGDIFSEKNVRSIRPGQGLHPQYLKEITGKKASRDLEKGTPLSWDMIS